MRYQYQVKGHSREFPPGKRISLSGLLVDGLSANARLLFTVVDIHPYRLQGPCAAWIWPSTWTGGQQYNLGMLLILLGDKKAGLEWVEKAAAGGSGEARDALPGLRVP